MVRTLALLLSLAPLAHAAPALETLSVADFLKKPQAPLFMPKGAPAKTASARKAVGEVRIYDRFGWTWESDATRAMQEAQSGLRAAGLAVLSSRVYRETGSGWNYGFRMEVLSDGYPPRFVESFNNGYYSFESEARQEAEKTASNLRFAGYTVVLIQVLRQSESPWNYSYFVDFVAPRRK